VRAIVARNIISALLEKIFRVVNDSVRGCQKVGNLEVRNQSIAREASNVMDSGYLLTANKNPNEKTVFSLYNYALIFDDNLTKTADPLIFCRGGQ
jgi:hypothetical protein